MDQWYVIQTKTKKEKLAEKNLALQGYSCFLPFSKQWRNRNGKRYQVIEPLFPRYLFIQLDLGKVNVSPIRSTFGVTGLVKFGNYIKPIPWEFLAGLKEQANSEGVIGQEPADFKEGQEVYIEQGILAGYSGIFQAKTGSERAHLLLSMLGYENKVEVPISLLSLAN